MKKKALLVSLHSVTFKTPSNSKPCKLQNLLHLQKMHANLDTKMKVLAEHHIQKLHCPFIDYDYDVTNVVIICVISVLLLLYFFLPVFLLLSYFL